MRRAISNWYEEKFNVSIDPEEEAIVTIGSKEGLAHLALATLNQGDSVIVPSPAYPIHPYGAVIAGAEIIYINVHDDDDLFFSSLDTAINNSWPTPKMIIANFPSNPTTRCVDINFLTELVSVHTILIRTFLHFFYYMIGSFLIRISHTKINNVFAFSS